MLVGDGKFDVTVIAGAGVTLAVAATIAAWLPARRATVRAHARASQRVRSQFAPQVRSHRLHNPPPSPRIIASFAQRIHPRASSARSRSPSEFRLTLPLPGAQAQWKFAPHPARKDWRPDDRPATARQAAALVVLYPGLDGPSFLLTERHHDLPHHPGQISLPGGGLDPGEDPEQGALREAHEEIGLRPRDVRIIGALSTLWVVVSNFLVHPIVGVADERPEFRAAPREVAALIEAPVRALWSTTTSKLEERSARRPARAVSVLRHRRPPHLGRDGDDPWGAPRDSEMTRSTASHEE